MRSTIGIGCTGGQHRSVAVAKALTDYLAARDANVRLRNRDFPKTTDGGAPCPLHPK